MHSRSVFLEYCNVVLFLHDSGAIALDRQTIESLTMSILMRYRVHLPNSRNHGLQAIWKKFGGQLKKKTAPESERYCQNHDRHVFCSARRGRLCQRYSERSKENELSLLARSFGVNGKECIVKAQISIDRCSLDLYGMSVMYNIGWSLVSNYYRPNVTFISLPLLDCRVFAEAPYSVGKLRSSRSYSSTIAST